MTTPSNDRKSSIIQELRNIRDDISNEIKDMTFEEERAYLDYLLAKNKPPAPNSGLAIVGQTLVD